MSAAFTMFVKAIIAVMLFVLAAAVALLVLSVIIELCERAFRRVRRTPVAHDNVRLRKDERAAWKAIVSKRARTADEPAYEDEEGQWISLQTWLSSRWPS